MSNVLVLQSPRLAGAWLPISEHYFPIPDSISGNVLRLPLDDEDNIVPQAVADEMRHHRIDFALLPDLAFSDIKLIVCDMDSTFTISECIDEIAAAAGLREQVAAITERAMLGEMDFAQALHERAALLKGQPESLMEEVYENRFVITPGAEFLVEECRRHGVKFMLVSGGISYFAERLKERLGLDWAFANRLETQNGRFTGGITGKIIDAAAKQDLLQRFMQATGATRAQTVAIGDGANDIPMLQAAGIGIAYHAKPKTRTAADCCIDFNGLNAVRNLFR